MGACGRGGARGRAARRGGRIWHRSRGSSRGRGGI